MHRLIIKPSPLKFLSVLVVLVIALLLYLFYVGYFARTDSASIGQSSSTFNYPSGWLIKEQSTKSTIVREPNEEGVLSSELEIGIVEIENKSLEEYFSIVDSNYNPDRSSGRTIKKGEIESVERINLNGIPTYKITADIAYFRSNSKEQGKAIGYIMYMNENLAFSAIAELHDSDLDDIDLIEKGLGLIKL